jgi:hypothetical protein
MGEGARPRQSAVDDEGAIGMALWRGEERDTSGGGGARRA